MKIKKFNENFDEDVDDIDNDKDVISMKNRIIELIQDSFHDPELSQLLDKYTNIISGELKLTGEIEAKYAPTPEFGQYTFDITIKRFG